MYCRSAIKEIMPMYTYVYCSLDDFPQLLSGLVTRGGCVSCYSGHTFLSLVLEGQ